MTSNTIHDQLKMSLPDFDFCVLLRRLGFPQNTVFGWRQGLVVGKHGPAHVLDFQANTGAGAFVCAAPTPMEMQIVAPVQFFVMRGPNNFMFIDAYRSLVKKVEDEKAKGAAVVFQKIAEADAPDLANCWAKGLIYLATKHKMKLSLDAIAELDNGKKK